jgi:hypothetical protein
MFLNVEGNFLDVVHVDVLEFLAVTPLAQPQVEDLKRCKIREINDNIESEKILEICNVHVHVPLFH